MAEPEICKYVMLNKNEPVIFRGPIKHKEMRAHECGGRKITSAAFFMIEDGVVTTFGESTSLGMPMAPNDAAIIEKFLKGTR